MVVGFPPVTPHLRYRRPSVAVTGENASTALHTSIGDTACEEYAPAPAHPPQSNGMGRSNLLGQAHPSPKPCADLTNSTPAARASSAGRNAEIEPGDHSWMASGSRAHTRKLTHCPGREISEPSEHPGNRQITDKRCHSVTPVLTQMKRRKLAAQDEQSVLKNVAESRIGGSVSAIATEHRPCNGLSPAVTSAKQPLMTKERSLTPNSLTFGAELKRHVVRMAVSLGNVDNQTSVCCPPGRGFVPEDSEAGPLQRPTRRARVKFEPEHEHVQAGLGVQLVRQSPNLPSASDIAAVRVNANDAGLRVPVADSCLATPNYVSDPSSVVPSSSCPAFPASADETTSGRRSFGRARLEAPPSRHSQGQNVLSPPGSHAELAAQDGAGSFIGKEVINGCGQSWNAEACRTDARCAREGHTAVLRARQLDHCSVIDGHDRAYASEEPRGLPPPRGRISGGEQLSVKVSLFHRGLAKHHRFTIQYGLGFQDFKQAVCKKIGLGVPFLISYQDDEGDSIFVTSNNEMQELFAIAKTSGITPVRISITIRDPDGGD